jgi:hypothetical protein
LAVTIRRKELDTGFDLGRGFGLSLRTIALGQENFYSLRQGIEALEEFL